MNGTRREVLIGRYGQNEHTVYSKSISLDLRFSLACSMPYALPWACTNQV